MILLQHTLTASYFSRLGNLVCHGRR